MEMESSDTLSASEARLPLRALSAEVNPFGQVNSAPCATHEGAPLLDSKTSAPAPPEYSGSVVKKMIWIFSIE
jgi:hypothetical protein